MTSNNGLHVRTRLRNLVSKEKRRFKDHRYDLDLTYITEKIIAMGFPSTGSEASYRNCAGDIYDFFEDRHKDHYKFYNLCSERAYPPEKYHGRVAHFPFDDHNPPPLGMLLYFCRDVEEYLAADPRNVVAIHCKAGKGRTGVMIVAYLLWCGAYNDAEEAMAFYGYARTNNQQGVTIPSQRTFITLWAKILQQTSSHEETLTRQKSGSSFIFTGDEAEDALVKAQILEGVQELKEDGHEDDSESDIDEDRIASSGGGSGDSISSSGSGSGASPQIDEASITIPPLPLPPPPPPQDRERRRDEGSEGYSCYPDDGAASLGSTSGRVMNMMKRVSKLAISGTPKRTTLAAAASPKECEARMDRSWNDRNRAEPPDTRGVIPKEELKCITTLRIITTPDGGYEPWFHVYSGGVVYDSKDMIPDIMYDDEDVIDIPVPDLPVIDEVLVVFFRRSPLSGSKDKLLKFWFHTSFAEDEVVVVPKISMDGASKDYKRDKRFKKNFRIEICLKAAPRGTPDPRKAKTVGPKYFHLQAEHERQAAEVRVIAELQRPDIQRTPSGRVRQIVVVEGAVGFEGEGGVRRSLKSRLLNRSSWSSHWAEYSTNGQRSELKVFQQRGQVEPLYAVNRDEGRRAMLRIPVQDAAEGDDSRWAVIEVPILPDGKNKCTE
jgi:protein-tyrosine phosphatase